MRYPRRKCKEHVNSKDRVLRNIIFGNKRQEYIDGANKGTFRDRWKTRKYSHESQVKPKRSSREGSLSEERPGEPSVKGVGCI